MGLYFWGVQAAGQLPEGLGARARQDRKRLFYISESKKQIFSNFITILKRNLNTFSFS